MRSLQGPSGGCCTRRRRPDAQLQLEGRLRSLSGALPEDRPLNAVALGLLSQKQALGAATSKILATPGDLVSCVFKVTEDAQLVSEAPAERPGCICVVAAGGQDRMKGQSIPKLKVCQSSKARTSGTLLGAAVPPNSSGRYSSAWEQPRSCQVISRQNCSLSPCLYRFQR